MWADEGVFYQIYPIGFCGAPRENDGELVPRIEKVAEWTDYFKELGITAVLFNPVFESDRHGYDTRDFRKIDCRLGTNEDFAGVCQKLHESGIKVILDGVFNHVGRGFFAFQDVLKNRESSRYKDWFYIRFHENNGYNDGLFYEGWEGHYDLVKLNLKHPEVVDYLLESVKLWVEEFGIDGLRLDVAYCLDREFMKRLKSFSSQLKPDFFLVGEMLFGDYKQIVNPEMLQSCTNYECYKGIYSSLNDKNLFEIAHSLNRQFGSDPYALYQGMHLMCFVDNHDVSRIASILKDKEHVSAAYALLFGMPGIPCIYYGSEWGAEGDKKNGDDGLRPAFSKAEENPLSELVKSMIQVYRQSPALQFGTFKNLTILNHQLIFERKTQEETILVALNLEETESSIRLEVHGEAEEMLTKKEVTLDGSYSIAPYGVAFLRLK